MNNLRFVFFGTSTFSIHVLDALEEKYFSPIAVVTFPDKPRGRKLILTPNPVKIWAEERSIRVIEVRTFKDEGIRKEIQEIGAEVFVVASFGKILPDWLIYMPPHKTLNVHPSLLPKLRGPSPIQEAILLEDTAGVSIMRLDEKMDEGPIVSQKSLEGKWPLPYTKAEESLGKLGGELLSQVLPKWIDGEIEEVPQDSNLTTYTKKIEKEEADMSNDLPKMAYRKILAYEVWPRARMGDLIVTSAHLEEDKLVIDRVVPPGKQEMSYGDYLRGKN